MPKVVIVGGGIFGLSLAHFLRRRQPDVELRVLEKGSRAGGAVWTEREEGFQFEFGPNGFLDNKPATLALSHELGLGDQLLPAREDSTRHRYVVLDGRLQSLPGSLFSLFTTRVLSWRAKWRVLTERFRPPRRV